jgi:hypothetical protein
MFEFGAAWFFDVSVSASVSLLHPQLTPLNA